ncbi:hypothetical protein EV14_1186 [Prochlorococcus sp. MIT 0703]|nr:hypothetical protein EV14_1186 [Prochlorococcus sp. MIT 0703]
MSGARPQSSWEPARVPGEAGADIVMTFNTLLPAFVLTKSDRSWSE